MTGPREVRKRFFGDTTQAQRYTKDAMNLLSFVKNQMGFAKLGQLSRQIVLASGVILFASSVFGQDEIRVFAPAVGPAVGGAGVVPEYLNPALRVLSSGMYDSGSFPAFTTTLVTMTPGSPPVLERDVGVQGSNTAGGYDSFLVVDGYSLRFYDRNWAETTHITRGSIVSSPEVVFVGESYYTYILDVMNTSIGVYSETGQLTGTYAISGRLVDIAPDTDTAGGTMWALVWSNSTYPGQNAVVHYDAQMQVLEQWPIVIVSAISIAASEDGIYVVNGNNDVGNFEIARYGFTGTGSKTVEFAAGPHQVSGILWVDGKIYAGDLHGDGNVPGIMVLDEDMGNELFYPIGNMFSAFFTLRGDYGDAVEFAAVDPHSEREVRTSRGQGQ